MSNVCCAMFNVIVKTPDDLLTKPPNPQWETIYSSGHFVSESFYKFIGHRTTDIRHLTALAVVDFFTVPMTAATAQRRATGSRSVKECPLVLSPPAKISSKHKCPPIPGLKGSSR